MKLFSRPIVLLMILSIFSNCRSRQWNINGETNAGIVAIFVSETEFDTDQIIQDLNCSAVAELFISMQDIVAYSEETHQIKLTNSTIQKFSQQDLTGYSFLMCVDDEVIYSGEFMAAYMSRSSDKFVILWPSMESDQTTIKIQLGYPSKEFFQGKDKRSHPLIIESLRKAGRLTP